MVISKTTAPFSVTPSGRDHHAMMDLWRSQYPNINAVSMVEKLAGWFKLPNKAAWIIVARYRNELHSRLVGV